LTHDQRNVSELMLTFRGNKVEDRLNIRLRHLVSLI
jgi:hypothetical protein